MYRLTCSVSGWGSVQNPLDEDERLSIEDGTLTVEGETLADALAEEYAPLTRDEEPTEPADETAESEDSQETDICGTEMSDGSTCQRPADECPYHGDSDD